MRTVGNAEASADAVVIGGGVIGLSVAREIARAGARVALVESGDTGAEASRAAGGMLAPQSEADRDDDFFRLQCASRALYPSFAAELREETGWDVELDMTGTLYLAFTEEDERELERRYLWQRSAGLSVERLTHDEIEALEPSVSKSARLALRFPNDWQVENRRLLAALRESAEIFYGVRVLSDTKASCVRVNERARRIEGVETSRGFVSAGAVVLAAGAWSSQIEVRGEGDGASLVEHPRVEPVRGQMLSFARETPHAPPLLRHVAYSPRGYVVPRRDARMLAGSTTEEAGFEKRVTAEGLHAILSNALEIAPALGSFRFSEAWSGLRPRVEDSLPVIGESEEMERLFYATGHYRNGILLAPLTARLISRMFVGVSQEEGDEEPSFRIETFSPARFNEGARKLTASVKTSLR